MRQALIILAFLLKACGRSASGRQPHDTPAQVSDPGAGGDKTPQDEAGPTRLAEAGATTRLRRAAPVWYTEQTPLPSRRIRAVGTEPFWSASVHDRPSPGISQESRTARGRGHSACSQMSQHRPTNRICNWWLPKRPPEIAQVNRR